MVNDKKINEGHFSIFNSIPVQKAKRIKMNNVNTTIQTYNRNCIQLPTCQSYSKVIILARCSRNFLKILSPYSCQLKMSESN